MFLPMTIAIVIGSRVASRITGHGVGAKRLLISGWGRATSWRRARDADRHRHPRRLLG